MEVAIGKISCGGRTISQVPCILLQGTVLHCGVGVQRLVTIVKCTAVLMAQASPGLLDEQVTRVGDNFSLGLERDFHQGFPRAGLPPPFICHTCP